MKLPFDENLSPKLPALVAASLPGSRHIRECGLKGSPDEDIWSYAALHGFVLVSKDSDFLARSALRGPPPKFVWLRIGNCTRATLVGLLEMLAHDIRALIADPTESVLLLP